MSQELKITTGIAYANGSLSDNKASSTQQITQNVQEFYGPVVSCGTGDAALTIAGITTLGWLYIKNLDPTNYVSFGPTSGGAIVKFGRIKPGEEHCLRLEPGITFRTQANTAACKLQFKFYGD